MPALRELLAACGHREVQTLFQSGNVVLTSDDSGERLRERLERELAEGLGMELDVVVRSAGELAEVVERNPLSDVATDPRRLQVTFLSNAPSAQASRELNEADVEPERIAVAGREIYVWHAGGIQRSPAARLLASARLGLHGTARNWNTVTRLLEMVHA